jgi:hypothetical protein
MSDLRADLPPSSDAAGVVRDAKIEELLLIGLDHYFAAQYEQAINVWTRVLFLDRGHARARAYIERARNAVAERQRESEELLQSGIAAFHRGDAETARERLEAAVELGSASDLALAFLGRLNRRDAAGADAAPEPRARPAHSERETPAEANRIRRPWLAIVAIAAVGVVGAAAAAFAFRGSLAWGALAGTKPEVRVTARVEPLPIPRAADGALARARALYRRGHLNEALVELDQIPVADVLRPDADRLKAEIQKTLIDTAAIAQPPRP